MASFLRRSSSSSSSAAGAAGKKKSAKADVDLHEAEPVPATRDVAVLMKERRAEIDKLKAAVDDVLKTQPTTETGEPWDGIWLKYDDIFFLRYILSFETAAKAEGGSVSDKIKGANLKSRVEGIWDFQYEKGSFPIEFRPKTVFFCEQYQAHAHWTLEGDKIDINWVSE